MSNAFSFIHSFFLSSFLVLEQLSCLLLQSCFVADLAFATVCFRFVGTMDAGLLSGEGAVMVGPSLPSPHVPLECDAAVHMLASPEGEGAYDEEDFGDDYDDYGDDFGATGSVSSALYFKMYLRHALAYLSGRALILHHRKRKQQRRITTRDVMIVRLQSRSWILVRDCFSSKCLAGAYFSKLMVALAQEKKQTCTMQKQKMGRVLLSRCLRRPY